MKTIRRIYFYLVAVVSLEVIVWALIDLARTMLDRGIVVTSEQLSRSLAFILVGLPVFLIHWRVLQREAAADAEERSSGTRALFLYAAWVGLSLPAVHSLIAILERALAGMLTVDPGEVAIGASQIWTDNLVSILVNSLLAAYIFSGLRSDWAAQPRGGAYALVRRIQRFFWMLYGLGLAYAGASQLLSYLFALNLTFAGTGFSNLLVDGLMFSLVGAPLWAYSWRLIQQDVDLPAERASRLRLWVLYAVALFAALTALIPTTIILEEILTFLFDPQRSGVGLLSTVGSPLSVALPSMVVWVFYRRALRREVQAVPEAAHQAARRQPYFYLLSAFGLVTTFIGLEALLMLLLNACFETSCNSEGAILGELSIPLAMLLVGLPVLLTTWRPVNAEARREDLAAEQARRSLVRRGYLYLVLFGGVMGVMSSAGFLIYNLLEAAFKSPWINFGEDLLGIGVTMLLFAGFAAFHWRVLREDNRRLQATTAARHADFVAAIFDPGAGPFAGEVLAAIEAECPDVQTALHRVGEALDKSLLKAGVAILPASLMADPPKALRGWLEKYSGPRLVVPDQAGEWVWVGVVDEPGEGLAKRAARVIRQLAEGEPLASSKTASPGMVVAYIVGSMAAISLLCIATSIFMDSL